MSNIMTCPRRVVTLSLMLLLCILCSASAQSPRKPKKPTPATTPPARTDTPPPPAAPDAQPNNPPAAADPEPVPAPIADSRRLPDQQFGIGLNIDGATVQYAIMPQLQAGITVGFWQTSINGVSEAHYELGPYARYLLRDVVNPFVQASLLVDGTTEGGSTTRIEFKVGLEYFFTPNIGAFAATPILELGLSPSSAAFGLGDRIVGGGEWYFTR